MKRKLNPFLREETDERGASATRKMLSEGTMPLERTRGLALPKPLTLEQLVAIMMPHLGAIQSPIFQKTDTHPTTTNLSSDSGKSHAFVQDQLTLSATMSTSVKPFECSVTPEKSGEDLFSRACSMLDKGESTHRFDCNTVGPIPVASGYGSRTLTQSAAHMLKNSKENASALSLANEKSYVQMGDNDLRELSETQIGVPVTPEHERSVVQTTCFTGSNLQSVEDGLLKRQNLNGGVAKITSLTGSTVSVMPEDQLVEAKRNGAVPKSSHFTIAYR